MKLGKVILENEKLGKALDNHRIVRAKLKELVSKQPEQVADLLTSLNIKATLVAPKAVLYSSLVKHLALNSELRAAISNMLLQPTSEYLNVTGQGMTIAGGALQALGGILTGIGRNQTMNEATTSMSEAERQKAEAERRKRQEEEDRKRKTNLAIGITIGVLVILGIVIAIVHASKKKKLAETARELSALNR